jgi:hypothetical protein
MIARKLSLLRKLLWAATLATGFGTLRVALVLWLGTSIQEAWQGGRRTWPAREDLVVRSDGTPLIESIPWENLSLTTYRDLSGRVQDAPDRDDQLPAVYMSGEHRTPDFFSWPLGWEQRLKAFIDEREPTVNWFFVHDGKLQGAGYFVGYERVSNRRVGFIGLSGFRTHSVPAAEWVPVRGELISDRSQWSSMPYYSGRVRVVRLDRWDLPPRLVYVPSGNRLRLVDLAARTVTTVFETPEPIESPGIPMHSSWAFGRPIEEPPILVRTRQQIYALNRNHKVIKVFIIPTEVDRQSPAQWYEIGHGQAIAVFVRPGSTGEPDNVTKWMVYRIAQDGAIQDRFEVALHNGSRAETKQVRASMAALAIPAPAILVVVDLLSVIGIDRVQSYPAVINAMLGSAGPSLFAVFVLSSVLAIMAWRRSRSFGLAKRERVAWVVFVLLFGFAAYVGFLLFRRWPIRQPCPNCHAQAPRDRAACAECGTRFPDPSLKGIEIFA